MSSVLFVSSGINHYNQLMLENLREIKEKSKIQKQNGIKEKYSFFFIELSQISLPMYLAAPHSISLANNSSR